MSYLIDDLNSLTVPAACQAPLERDLRSEHALQTAPTAPWQTAQSKRGRGKGEAGTLPRDCPAWIACLAASLPALAAALANPFLAPSYRFAQVRALPFRMASSLSA